MAERLVVTPERRAIRRNAPVYCPSCGRAVVRKARQQRYCSARCKEKGRQRTRKALLGQDTGAPTHRPKFINKNNGLQSREWRPSPGISAPSIVIRGEMFAGRRWEQVTSDDGVTCLIARRAG